MASRGRVVFVAGAIAVGAAVLAGGFYIHAQNEARQEAVRAEAARVEALWQARMARARALAANVTLNDNTVRCELKDAQASPARSAGDPHADFLMTVAEQPLVVFLVPGFEYKTEGGWQSFEYIRTRFVDEIAAARDIPEGSAVCLVRWPTQLGFGDDTPYLANAVDAVRQLSDDHLLPGQRQRRIVVIGYSAGGNFAAYALTHLPAFARDPAASDTDIRLVTMGAPHRGSDLAQLAPDLGHLAIGARAFLAQISDDAEGEKQAKEADQSLTAASTQRGIRQLQPGDPDVAALNTRLEQMGSALPYLSVYSSTDEVVPTQSAMWQGALAQIDLVGYRHTDFPAAPVGSVWRRVLSVAFGDAPLSQPAVDRAAQAPTPDATVQPAQLSR